MREPYQSPDIFRQVEAASLHSPSQSSWLRRRPLRIRRWRRHVICTCRCNLISWPCPIAGDKLYKYTRRKNDRGPNSRPKADRRAPAMATLSASASDFLNDGRIPRVPLCGRVKLQEEVMHWDSKLCKCDRRRPDSSRAGRWWTDLELNGCGIFETVDHAVAALRRISGVHSQACDCERRSWWRLRSADQAATSPADAARWWTFIARLAFRPASVGR